MVAEVVAMIMAVDPPLHVGDRVAVKLGAPVPRRIQAGARGQVVVVNEDTGEVSVLFRPYGRPVRLHRRWLHYLPPERSRGGSKPIPRWQ
jgi:hypothetical protein